MKIIFLSGSTPVDHSLNNSGEYNNLLLKALSKAGFQVGSLENASVFINLNHDKNSVRKASRNSRVFKVLIRTEPISVFPAQYTMRVENQYDLVITTGRPKRRIGKFLDIHHPYRTLSNPNFPELEEINHHNQHIEKEEDVHSFSNWNRRPIYLSMIASNKVSTQKENYYDLRRKFASEALDNGLEIYGTLWNASYTKRIRHRVGVGLHALRYGTIPNLPSLYGGLHRSYASRKGAPQDKQIIVRSSKFSLVIENSNTYLSEKLFDAFVGGSIPIFFGPELSKYGIKEDNLVIRHQGSLSKLRSHLENISESEILVRLDSIKQFVESNYFLREWDAENIFSEASFAITELQERL